VVNQTPREENPPVKSPEKTAAAPAVAEKKPQPPPAPVKAVENMPEKPVPSVPDKQQIKTADNKSPEAHTPPAPPLAHPQPAAAAAPPAPAPQPLAPALYTGECRIVIAKSCAFPETATSSAAELAKLGYETNIYTETIGKTTAYHLVLGIYPTQADAEQAAREFTVPGYTPSIKKSYCENMAFPASANKAQPAAEKSPDEAESIMKDDLKPDYRFP
jgi:hypothetical protein